MRKILTLAFSICCLFLAANPLAANLLFPSPTAQETYLQSVDSYLAHPFVALPPAGMVASTTTGAESIQMVDLRGNPDFAQPNELSVCGTPDTIPLLLFTKSIEPIFDAELMLDFGTGLEFSGFAYVASGNADLDTINVENPANPVFRIDEISLTTGAVVVYVGIQAGCNFLALSNPNINFELDYVSEGVACTTTLTPDVPYGGSVLQPQVGFVPSNIFVNINDATTTRCANLEIEQTTPNTSAQSAIVTLTTPHVGTSIDLVDVRVEGTSVPASDIVDNGDGTLTITLDNEANPGYFGTDGLLFGEGATLSFCYLGAEECFSQFTVNTTIVFACRGELCGGGAPDTETFRVRPLSNINPGFSLENLMVTQQPSACGMDGTPDNYIVQFDLVSTSTDFRADITNLAIVIDSCTTLVPDTMYLAGANPGMLTNTFTGSDGRIIFDLDRVESDPDGAGVGLDDLDGDGHFDDLPGGEMITVVVEFAPDVPEGCGSGIPICDFTDIIAVARSNCNVRGANRTGVLADDFLPVSTAGTGGDTTTYVVNSNTINGGFNFGTVNNGTPTQTRTVEHSYDLSPADLACTTVGRRLVEVQFITNNNQLPILDAVISNVVDATLIETSIDSDTTVVTWLLEVDDSALDINTVSFDITMDSITCSTTSFGRIDIFTIDECDGCPDSRVFRACTSNPFRVFNGGLGTCTQPCNSEALLTLTRVSTGFTDRTLATEVTPEEAAVGDIGFSAPDNSPPSTVLQVLPGDTVAMHLQVVVTEPDVWNGSDRLAFQIDDERGRRNRVTHLWDYPAARLTDFSLSRTDGSSLDLGGVSDGQGVDGFYTVGNGGTNLLSTATTQTHPGLSHDDWRFGTNSSNNDLQFDGDHLTLAISNSFDGTRTHVDEIYAAIGGEFLVGDTINVVWWVPMMRIPRTSGHNDDDVATSTYDLVTSPFEVATTSLSYITEGAEDEIGDLDANKVIIRDNVCSSVTSLYFHEPMPKSDVRIEYSDDNGDGCDAQIVIDYTVDDVSTLLAEGAFTNEYRPILGLEQFTAEIPASFYLDASTVSYELLNTSFSGSVTIDQSTSDVVNTGGSSFLYSGTSSTTITFRDTELDDGTNWLNYEDELGQGEIDVTQIGGELPLLGVGGEAFADPDTLRIIIPLKRLCPMDPTTPLTLNSTLDYPYLPDYSSNPWRCGSNANQRWFNTNEADPDDRSCPSTPGEAAWSFNFNRGTDGNAHRIQLDSLYQSVNAPDPYVAPTTSLSMPSLMDTDPGSESNTYTLTANSDLGPDSRLYIKVANAVELLGVTGDATTFTEVSNDEDGTVYEVSMGALNTGDMFTINLETEQLFCEAAGVTISTLTGCVTEESAAIAGLGGVVCPGVVDSYSYEAGKTGLEVDLVYNTDQIGCIAETYTLNYENTGSSPLTDFSPVVFLQEGLDIVPGSFTVATSTSVATGIDDPTEESGLTGVPGVAYTWPAGYLDNAAFGTDEVVEGELVSISFMAQATCDFISGLPIATSIEAANVCGEDSDVLLATGEPIRTVPEDALLPGFDVQLSGNEACCGELAEPITITMLNNGASVGQTEVCFTLPPGVTITEADIEAVAPTDYMPVINPPVPLGTGGATQLCIQGPEDLAVGEFICLNISPDVTLDCGEVEIGLLVTTMVSITCGGVDCEVSATEAPSNFSLKVVPPLTVSDASLVANCNPTDGLIDIQVEAMLENLQAGDFAGNVEVSLFSDTDGNGELDDFETLIAGPFIEMVNAAPGELLMINPSFTVPASDACPLLLEVSIPGCDCSDLVIPFDEVPIPLAEELGEFLTICPGVPYMVDAEICGNVSLAFDPVNAGTAVDNGSGLEITINEGFGVDGELIPLIITKAIGGCGESTDTTFVSQLETFEYDDVEVTLCDEGCQTVSLGVDPALEDDMVTSFTPDLYITDATSVTPEICDPASNLSYDVELMLNGQCTANLTLAVTVVESPTLTVTAGAGCQTGFNLASFLTISPADLDGTFSAAGTGTFSPGARLSDNPTYTPSPEDIKAGEVVITLRTDNPDGPCAGLVARETFTILLVDCGSFFWDGSND